MDAQAGVTTRQALVAAAAEVFEREGYARATVDEVCERAGVTKGALYGHFGSKKALAVAVLDVRAAEWARTRERLQRQHRSPLQVLVDLGYAAQRDQEVERRLMFQSPVCEDVAERRLGQWTSVVHDLPRGAAARGELRDGVNLPACAEGIVAELVGVHLVSRAVDGVDAATAGVVRLWRSRLPALAWPEVCAGPRMTPPR